MEIQNPEHVDQFFEESEGFLSRKSTDCEGKVKVVEQGNPQYAWFFLLSKADADIKVTTEYSWVYENRRLLKTERHKLYPGERKNIFNMPRNQQPTCTITHCNVEA